MQRSILMRLCGFFTLMFIGLGVSVAAHAELNKSQVDSISNATFEVVQLKPTQDSLTYERTLPMDLIPFAIRNDQYFSVGTAFAIGDNKWITAAHVLALGGKSQNKLFRLRDKAGKVYDLDKIVKYSKRRDFVVFTIKNAPSVQPLVANATPQLNDKVYAVGNALGEGIVFRDGLYTSSTQEEEDGAWKWIRFSAAASPGNSGGPLLDSEGKVIGVVRAKSENENLNYALPIAEVLNAPDNVADLEAKMMYVIDNIPNQTKIEHINKRISLPMTYAELDKVLIADLFNFGLKLQNDFFAEQHGQIFPNDEGSLRLLNSNYDSSAMLGLIARGDDGVWDAYFPKEPQNNDIGKNGNVVSGTLGDISILRFHKPDDVKTEELFKNSKLLMDKLLQGHIFYRTIASQKIKITSMGKAAEEFGYTDHYDRKWLVKIWNIEYSDDQVALFILPVPGGYKAMMRLASTEMMPGYIEDLKVLTDFVYVSYYGTLAKWQDFLSHRELLPKALADLKLDFQYGKHFRFSSKRLAFSYGPEEMKITDRSDLKFRLAYFRDGDKVVWDVAYVQVGEDKDSSVFYALARNTHPPAKLGDDFSSNWNKMSQRAYPFNKNAFFSDNRTLIGGVLPSTAKGNQKSGPNLLYTTFYSVDGSIEQKNAETKLSRFMGKVSVFED